MSYIKKDRTYTINGKELPSVTTILGCVTPPQLIHWFKTTSLEDQTKISEKALDIGKALHAHVELYLNTGVMPTTDNETINKCLEAFAEFEATHGKIEPIAVEAVVHTKDYAGTLDCMAKIGTKTVLLDLKTSKKIYDTYRLQVHAYAYAWNQMHGWMPDELMIIRLDKEKGNLECVAFPFTRKEFSIFKGVKDYYYWSKK